MATVEVVSGNQTLRAKGDDGKVDTHAEWRRGGDGGMCGGVMP